MGSRDWLDWVEIERKLAPVASGWSGTAASVSYPLRAAEPSCDESQANACGGSRRVLYRSVQAAWGSGRAIVPVAAFVPIRTAS